MNLQILKSAISEDLGDTYPHVIVYDLKAKRKHPVVELGEYKKKNTSGIILCRPCLGLHLLLLGLSISS